MGRYLTLLPLWGILGLEVMPMPREAREKTPFGIYWIRQDACRGMKLFRSEEDRLCFMRVLKEKKNAFDFKLYGCSLSEEEAYQMILFTNGGDISKIMKAVNIGYAVKRQGGGKVFSSRFKSELLKTPEALAGRLDVLNRISACRAGSPHCSGLLDRPPPVGTLPGPAYEREEDEMSSGSACPDPCVRTLEEGKAFLREWTRRNGWPDGSLRQGRQKRNLALLALRKQSTLSLKELGSLFGGLSESAVCKIISRSRKEDPS